MTSVVCALCEKSLPIDECWCVSDSKTNTRAYECKMRCVEPTVFQLKPEPSREAPKPKPLPVLPAKPKPPQGPPKLPVASKNSI